MKLRVHHTTHYAFEAPLLYGVQQVRKTPRPRAGLEIATWSLAIEGGKAEAGFRDQHGNLVTLVSIEPQREEIAITCSGEVETRDLAGVVGAHMDGPPLWYYQRETPLTTAGPAVEALVDRVRGDEGGDIARLHALSAAILEAAPYEIGPTHAMTSAEESLAIGRGVCQDHAHVFIAAARRLGFPARYVSGYLFTTGADIADAGHAWAEAYAEGIGWIGFDVSNAVCPDERYIAVALGLDAIEASPVRGVTTGAGAGTLTVQVQVLAQQQ